MDSYSGSEPRLFISFRLGNESNDQPPRRSIDEERMNSNDSFVTAASNSERPLTGDGPACNLDLESPNSANPEEFVAASPTNPESEATQGNLLVENPHSSQMQLDSSGPTNVVSGDNTTPVLTAGSFLVESSSTDESCGEYIVRKWAQLGCSAEVGTSSQGGGTADKFSESVAIELAPGQDVARQEEMETDSVSEVAFLDAPKLPFKSNLKSRYGPPEAKALKLSIKLGNEPRVLSVAADQMECPTLTESENEFSDDFRAPHSGDKRRPKSPARICSDVGQDSEGLVGSTVADALFAPTSANLFSVCDTASNTSVDFPEAVPRDPQLSASSRALIKEYFEAATPVELPAGHSTLALNEGQVCHVLKVVADEAVKSSLKVMENLIQQASRLNLGTPHLNSGVNTKPRKSVDRVSGGESQSGFLSDHGSDTSGAIKSTDDFASIGYSYEHSDLESHPFTPPPAGPPGCSRADLGSFDATNKLESPGAQTLAGLKAEAVAEKTKTVRQKKSRKTPTRNSGPSRHRVPRGCKIMKEAYFKGMEWTKTFVSGPVDPRWNPYKFYCQICKGNISIYGRGAREILRHHATERHLRKDQRWRYEHLATEDPITKVVKHHVRGRDGKLLTPFELQRELPCFIEEQLVDIGEKLPFYDEYIQGTDYMASSSENRVRIQISVLGNYLRSQGDISILKSFWRDVGVIVNHQSLFTDFNWSKERLSVSTSSVPTDLKSS